MKDWTGQKVLIIGAARQGLAMARYLANHDAEVVVNDQRPAEQLHQVQEGLDNLPIQWILGGHPLSALDNVSLVCVSGGVSLELPLLVEAQRRDIPLTNDSQVFMEAVPCKTIGITGSAGKTTTTTLVGRILQAGMDGPGKVWVGGNIGQPLITSVDEMKPEDLVVLELSSFQLELMTVSPTIGAILNITPNHLDRHGTMEAYTAAKARILDFQKSGDIAVLGRDDPGAWNLRDKVQGRLVSFGISKPQESESGTYIEGDSLFWTGGNQPVAIMPKKAIQLRGQHNVINVLAACAIAASAGFSAKSMQAGIEGFTGVIHRLELVRIFHGAAWYNGSIATAPERSMADIRSFDEPLVLLSGGRDKKLPWDEFAKLVHERVDHLILFGEAAEMIAKVVGPVQPSTKPYSIQVCGRLEEAVEEAANIAEPGDVVLLSPGGTSFDEFKDFEERGERFIQWVKALS